MVWLIWGGAVVAFCGVLALAASGVAAVKARAAAAGDDAELRRRLTRLLPWNFGALGLAVLGLMAVIVGLFLR